METIKIKVNLPRKVYDILLHDMEVFGFKKDDGSINKNNFLNVLIKNYFPTYSEIEGNIADKIMSQINIKEKDYSFVTSVFFETGYKKDGNYSKDLQFIIKKENIEIYEEIFNLYLRDRTISQYFREMFILYSSNPQDKREEIIFKGTINKLKQIIANGNKAFLYLKNGQKKIADLYKVVPTMEEMFNYVIGVELNNDGRKIFTYHLNEITSIIEINKQKTQLLAIEKEKLDLMVYQNPAFEINKIYDAEVSLTEIGERLFNLWIHDRPKPYKVDGNRYFFRGSLTHIVIYFFKFANEAKIESPSDLKEFISERYKIALESYEK